MAAIARNGAPEAKEPHTEKSTCINKHPRESQKDFPNEWAATQNSRKLYCVARSVLCELSESERRRTLKEAGENRGVGPAANILIGQRREKSERGDNSDEEKRQNRQRTHAAGVAMRDQHTDKGDSDCNSRNQ
jgi:hypothetical protein